MPAFRLDGLDLGLVIAYLVFAVLLGLYYARRSSSAEGYFLAGRTLTWPAIGFSLFATQMSASTLIGLTGSGYASGYVTYVYAWFAAIALIVLALFFLPYYLKQGLYTLPEYLARRFDGRARTYHAAISLVGNVLIDMAGALYAGALLVRLVLPGVPLWQTIAVMAVLTALYTVSGGLAAVVATDKVQAVLLLIGTILVAYFAFAKLGGDWQAVRDVTGADLRTLIRPADDDVLPWPGLLVGVPLLGFYYWCANQAVAQRALAAKTLREGQYGALFAGLLHLPLIFLLTLPGTAARVLYPDLADAAAAAGLAGQADRLVFPTLLFDLLPEGVLGLVLAGFVAALMSSIDSAMNAGSTLATMDFYKRWRPEASAERLMQVGKLFTFGFAALAAVWAPQIEHFPSFWDYLQQVLSFITPPVAACFLLGLFWRRANAAGAVAGLGIGALVGIGILVAQVGLGWWSGLHFLYVAGILFAVSALAIVVGSLGTAPPAAEQVAGTVWTRAVLAEADAGDVAAHALPVYKRPVALAIALLVTSLAVFAYFA